MEASAAEGKLVIIQSSAKPSGNHSSSAIHRKFGENKRMDIPLYNGRLKVADVLALAATMLAREKPAGWCNPASAYFLGNVEGGAKGYHPMRPVDGYYNT